MPAKRRNRAAFQLRAVCHDAATTFPERTSDGTFSRLRGKTKTPQQEAMARNPLIPSVFVMTVDGSLDKSEIVQLANG